MFTSGYRPWLKNVACLSSLLRKLRRQTGNSSLLPAKCWPLLHVIRACSWRWPDAVARISPRFSKFAFVLFCFITNHLMTGPLGNSEFYFPRISTNTEILGQQNSLFPSGPVIKCLMFHAVHSTRGDLWQVFSCQPAPSSSKEHCLLKCHFDTVIGTVSLLSLLLSSY